MEFENIFNYTNLIIGTTTSVCVKLLGGEDYIIQVLLMLMIMEYFSDLFLSYKHIRQRTRGERFLIIAQKLGMLWIVALGVIVDKMFILDNQLLNSRNTLISFFIGFEGLTVVENYDIIGIKLPNKLRNIFFEFMNKNN